MFNCRIKIQVKSLENLFYGKNKGIDHPVLLPV